MITETMKDRLQAAVEEVDDISLKLRGEEARKLRKAMYLIDEVRTSAAVGELVQAAYTFHGGQGDAEPVILRERAATSRPSLWKCLYCDAISQIDHVSDADGLCVMRPTGIGRHTFRQVISGREQLVGRKAA